MPNPRKTAAPPASLTLVLPLVLALFLLPAGAHAVSAPGAPGAPGAPEEGAATSDNPADALAAAWDWLLSLVEPREELDGLLDLRLPAWNEGSHLDPNGGC
jgi:hypothetical protein